jgi:drug/metabolite transporter (DMT)-like permease
MSDVGALSAAVLCVLAYTAMNVLFKRHTHNGGGAVSLTAWLGLLAPLWLLVLALGTPTHLLVIPHESAYWLWSAVWAILLPGTTLLMVHLLKTLSLSELTAARKALVTLLAVGVDFFVLATPLRWTTLLAIGVITVAALSLPAPPVRKLVQRLPLRERAAWLGLLALLFTLQLTAYKKALLYQPDLASHIVIVKALAALACLPLFAFERTGKAPPLRLALGVIGCYFLGSVSEGYALQGLPLSVLVAVTTATAALMAAHDLWKKDLPRSFKTYGLLGVILAGFVLLAFA